MFLEVDGLIVDEFFAKACFFVCPFDELRERLFFKVQSNVADGSQEAYHAPLADDKGDRVDEVFEGCVFFDGSHERSFFFV